VLAGERRAGPALRRNGAGQEPGLPGALGIGDQRRELASERRILLAQRVQPGRALRGREFEQVVQQRAEPPPALGVSNDPRGSPRAR
jgi:hypothetical protein